MTDPTTVFAGALADRYRLGRELAFPSVGPLIRQRAALLATLFDTDRFSFDASKHLADVRVPTMVITGAEDQLVRISDVEAVLHTASGLPEDLIVVEGGGHNGLWRHAIAWQAMNRLLDRVMPGTCKEPP